MKKWKISLKEKPWNYFEGKKTWFLKSKGSKFEKEILFGDHHITEIHFVDLFQIENSSSTTWLDWMLRWHHWSSELKKKWVDFSFRATWSKSIIVSKNVKMFKSPIVMVYSSNYWTLKSMLMNGVDRLELLHWRYLKRIKEKRFFSHE